MTKQCLKYLTALMAILFVVVQTSAMAHAIHHDDAPHSHEGVPCDIEAIASEQDVIEPLSTVKVITEIAVTDYETVFMSATYVIPQGRAPPPRAPPQILF